MKPKLVLMALVCCLMVPASALAAEWVPFFRYPHLKVGWVYDREGITYFREKEIIGLFNIKDNNFPKIWFKSQGQNKERRLVIEMDCPGRTGRLFDDGGNFLYSDKEVDYLAGQQFKPDSVLEALHTKVCEGDNEKEMKGKKP